MQGQSPQGSLLKGLAFTGNLPKSDLGKFIY